MCIRDRPTEEAAPAVDRHPGDGREEVLGRERHAPERALGDGAASNVPGAVEEPLHHCVEPRVDALDASDGLVDQLAWGDLSPAHQLGHGHRVERPVLGDPHRVPEPTWPPLTHRVAWTRPTGRADSWID